MTAATAIPHWDEKLWKRALKLTNNAEVANAMTVYEVRWYTGEKFGWTEDRVQRWEEAEERLSSAVKMRA